MLFKIETKFYLQKIWGYKTNNRNALVSVGMNKDEVLLCVRLSDGFSLVSNSTW